MALALINIGYYEQTSEQLNKAIKLQVNNSVYEKKSKNVHISYRNIFLIYFV